MNIAFCDDEQSQLNITEAYTNEWAQENNIKVNIKKFRSAEAFLFEWSSLENFNMLFLDIQMGGMSGIELAKQIRQIDDQIIIVFITGIKDYVFEGYDVKALRYLIKPIKKEAYKACLDEAFEEIQKRNREMLLIPLEGQLRKVAYQDIYYFEVFSHYMEVHTKYGLFKYKKKIGELESELPSTQFIRCHRSCIVNLLYISSIEKKLLKLDNEDVLPVSSDRRKLLHDSFVKYYS